MSNSKEEFKIDTERISTLINKVNNLTDSVESLMLKYNHGLKNNWLNSDEVCLKLNISKRKLQQLRTDKLIQFTKKGKKIYYKSVALDKYLEQK